MQRDPPDRRFPEPWTTEKTDGGYKIRDANGISLAYVYARDDLRCYTSGWQHLTSDEARRIAAAIARIPEFMKATKKTQ